MVRRSGTKSGTERDEKWDEKWDEMDEVRRKEGQKVGRKVGQLTGLSLYVGRVIGLAINPDFLSCLANQLYLSYWYKQTYYCSLQLWRRDLNKPHNKSELMFF